MCIMKITKTALGKYLYVYIIFMIISFYKYDVPDKLRLENSVGHHPALIERLNIFISTLMSTSHKNTYSKMDVKQYISITFQQKVHCITGHCLSRRNVKSFVQSIRECGTVKFPHKKLHLQMYKLFNPGKTFQ